MRNNRNTSTKAPCKTCGGKGYLIKAVRVGGGFVREDDVCPRCRGKSTVNSRKEAA